MFDSTGKYILLSGSNVIYVYHNVTGYKCDIATARKKLKHCHTSALKERLEKMINDNEAFLRTIAEKEEKENEDNN